MASSSSAYISSLPIYIDNTDQQQPFWEQYISIHYNEHQMMAQAINSMLSFLSLPLMDYGTTEIYPFEPPKVTEPFFSKNYNDHQLFMSYLNMIGQHITNPNYIYPIEYPSPNYDLDSQFFLMWEKRIHTNIFTAINVDMGIST